MRAMLKETVMTPTDVFLVLYTAVQMVGKRQRKTHWFIRGSFYNKVMTQNIRRKELDGSL